MFRFAWLVASLVFAVWAPTVRAVPTKEPPPLWSGESGWRSDPESLRVHEGRRQVGEVLAEYNVQLKRTGVVKKTIRVKTPRGEWTIPEGTKAFAVDTMLALGAARTPQKINPIEWCMYLPGGSDGVASASETLCAFWEDPKRARYEFGLNKGSPFRPSLSPPTAKPSPLVEIEEQPVDFGFQSKWQMRLTGVTAENVSFESEHIDGTFAQRDQSNTDSWGKAGSTFSLFVQDRKIDVKLGSDLASIEIKLLDSKVQSLMVLLDILVGVDGRPKEVRIGQSSGSPQVDEAAVKSVMSSWKLVPATENGKPVERWGRFTVKFNLED
jgi:TonB family protein